MTLEATIVRAGERVLDQRGAWHVRQHRAGVGRNGIPDTLACYRGRFLAIEWKSPQGRVRPLQAHELGHITRADGIAIVARSAAHVTEALDYIDSELDAGRLKAA